jgi:hypothetical protein
MIRKYSSLKEDGAMKYMLMLTVCGMMVLGCAQGTPVVPDETSIPDLSACQSGAVDEGPYRLWGEYDLYISADHERVEAVPKRTARFHLNALRFLEETCRNCLQILSVKSNLDGTIDLTIRITHPFRGFPQYTGFDVKGIIMFDGSYEFPKPEDTGPIPVPGTSFRISWREMGDPEVLNADGLTFRWNPEWDEGSSRPILNYWPGRWSNGTPTAHINAYLNFYSHEERHMFAHDRSVTRTYHIWLPPEPIVAGYAVEACWEPATVMPVTNPDTDFPVTANQPEAYLFEVVVNNGNPITDCEDCCTSEDCEKYRWHFNEWYEPSGWCPGHWYGFFCPFPGCHGNGGSNINIIPQCSGEYDGWYTKWGPQNLCAYGNGKRRYLAYLTTGELFQPHGHAYDFIDFVVDDPDLD